MGNVSKLLRTVEERLAPHALSPDLVRHQEAVLGELLAQNIPERRARRLIREATARLQGEDVPVRSSSTPVSVYLNDAEAEWVKAHGGSRAVRELIDAAMREPELNPRDKIIAVDFDGVLHAHRGWTGAADIPEPPVAGALEWLREIVEDGRFTVCIFSSRNCQPGGVQAIKSWLLRWGIPLEIVEAIQFPTVKPPAHVLIDDRGVGFWGEFPSPDEIANFRPWWK